MEKTRNTRSIFGSLSAMITGQDKKEDEAFAAA